MFSTCLSTPTRVPYRFRKPHITMVFLEVWGLGFRVSQGVRCTLMTERLNTPSMYIHQLRSIGLPESRPQPVNPIVSAQRTGKCGLLVVLHFQYYSIAMLSKRSAASFLLVALSVSLSPSLSFSSTSLSLSLALCVPCPIGQVICAVCLEEIQPSERRSQAAPGTGCVHTFHWECIRPLSQGWWR